MSSPNEENLNPPIESSSKIKLLPQCRLIAPNEIINFGKKQLKNIGKHPTIACEISEDFTENQVLADLEHQPWYPEYAKQRHTIIEKCQLEGKVSQKKCESREYVNSQLHIGTDTDPFDTKNATHFRTRYLANLIGKLYPSDLDEKGKFKNKFHARAVHYKLLSENIGFPTFTKHNGWQLSKYVGSSTQWDNLKEGLTEARNGGLIPFAQMRDARVPLKQ